MSAPCQLVVGVFLRRACARPSAATCSRCHRLACTEHTRMVGLVPMCVDCVQATSSVQRSTTFIDTSIASGSSGDVAPDFIGGGGTFGGAGATGGWDPADTAAPAAGADFSAQDFAAFDSLTDSDKDTGGTGYDS